MQARGQGEIDYECQSRSTLSVRVSGPEPSAIPSPSPTLSLEPSPEPTISFQPTTSINPTPSPTNIGSSNPTISIHPTSMPTFSPSDAPTSSPTDIASPNPTISIHPTSIPTSLPSDAPSLTPTQSPSDIPSTNPSISPSKSTNPSSSPTITVEPSQVPTMRNLPSASPTKSHLPSTSLSPTFFSGSPSVAPSNTASACIDDGDWVLPITGTTSITCAGITELLCTFYSKPEYISNGKVANDACCKCGGSEFYELPSSQPSQCEDVPDWKLENTDTGCGAYDGASDIVCELAASNSGIRAVDACCGCGGGTHISPVPSLAPSSIPSNAPSECIDDYNWDVFYNEEARNCDFIERTPALCNLDGIGSNDKTANEACCKCGGGIQTSVSPSRLPSIIPSSAPSECEDIPDWEIITSPSITLTCSDMRSNCPGLSNQIDVNGVSGSEACCGCGGGTHTSPVPSLAPNDS